MPSSPKQHQRIGRFEVLEEFGPGRRGLLFRAHDNLTGRDVALELCQDDGPADPGRRARRQRAVRTVAGASHPRAVRVYEDGEHDGRAFFVSEWPLGRSLVEVCANGTFLPIPEALSIVADLGPTLQAAHENGVVHGDLHLGNVWLDPDGTVRVRGFGTASFRPAMATLRLGAPDAVSGVAPEQVVGDSVDGRTDVFTAGAILYELLSGRSPFEGDNAAEILDRVAVAEFRPIEDVSGPLPAPIVAAVHRALARTAGDRYPSAFQFAADLQRIRRSLEQPRAPARVRRPRTPAQGVSPPSPSTPKPLIDTMRSVLPPVAPGEAPRVGARRVALAAILLLAALVAAVGGVALSRSCAVRPALQSLPQTAPDAPVPRTAPGDTPAPPPVPPLKSVRLTSTPDGAQVVVNGQRTQMLTPATMTLPADKAVGTWIRMTKDGFTPAEVRLDETGIAAGSVGLSLATEPQPVAVALAGEHPVSVFDGTKRLSPPATSHTLAALEGTMFRT